MFEFFLFSINNTLQSHVSSYIRVLKLLHKNASLCNYNKSLLIQSLNSLIIYRCIIQHKLVYMSPWFRQFLISHKKDYFALVITHTEIGVWSFSHVMQLQKHLNKHNQKTKRLNWSWMYLWVLHPLYSFLGSKGILVFLH